MREGWVGVRGGEEEGGEEGGWGGGGWRVGRSGGGRWV